MIFPPLLTQGDKVLIVAPSGKISSDGIDKAIHELEAWGLEVVLGQHVYSSNATFAGTDAERLHDFQDALDIPSINLIFCARGGYGFTRFLDNLSFDQYVKYPKWVVGFSDITAFQLAILTDGMASIHGPMGTSFSRIGTKESVLALKTLLFDGTSLIQTNEVQLKAGVAKGILVGGNLALICDSLGTGSEIDIEGKILVLEDVGEHLYRVDRMLTQLKRAKKLSNLKGLVIGSFSQILDGSTPFGETIAQMVNRLTLNYNYPVALGMPIGHESANYPFVQGAEYILEVENNRAKLELTTKL